MPQKVVGAIPPNTVVYIGGVWLPEEGEDTNIRYYLLHKDGYTLVVQARETVEGPQGEDSSQQKLLKERIMRYGLETIQALLPNIEFGKYRFVELIDDMKGNFRLQPIPNRKMPRVTCPTWAELIDETEITYTQFWFSELRTGYWRGREVEVMMGDIPRFRKHVDTAMRNYLMMQSMGLEHFLHKILAHIVRDGEVVGLITEPVSPGRQLQVCDRSMVYEIFAQFERMGIIYGGADSANVSIENGQLKLFNLIGIWKLQPGSEECKAKAIRRHWNCLEVEYDWRLAGWDNVYGFEELPALHRRDGRREIILAECPAPDFIRIIALDRFALMCQYLWTVKRMKESAEYLRKLRDKKMRKHAGASRNRSLLLASDEFTSAESRALQIVNKMYTEKEAPLILDALERLDSHRRAVLPYLMQRPKVRKVLLPPE